MGMEDLGSHPRFIAKTDKRSFSHRTVNLKQLDRTRELPVIIPSAVHRSHRPPTKQRIKPISRANRRTECSIGGL
jgi:hypothetical protein